MPPNPSIDDPKPVIPATHIVYYATIYYRIILLDGISLLDEQTLLRFMKHFIHSGRTNDNLLIYQRKMLSNKDN